MNIADKGKNVTNRNFLGSKIPRDFKVRGSSVALSGDNKDSLLIQGINLNDVSQTDAHISNDCAKRKKTDIRIFMYGIFVVDNTTSVTQ